MILAALASRSCRVGCGLQLVCPELSCVAWPLYVCSFEDRDVSRYWFLERRSQISPPSCAMSRSDQTQRLLLWPKKESLNSRASTYRQRFLEHVAAAAESESLVGAVCNEGRVFLLTT